MTTRRQFLQTAGSTLLTPFVLKAIELQASGAPGTTAPDPATVFGLSVASGDPSATGVVLWTRVNPAAWSSSQPLQFEVAADDRFRRVIVAGEVQASDFGADRDYTVHLDLEGLLESSRRYFYRFRYGTVTSRVGRCRTLPSPGSTPRSLKLAVLTCQDYTNGYYGAFSHLATDDVDFVVHLGDFIYETTGDPTFQSLPYPDRTFELPSGQPAAVNVDDFRFIYRQYRSDPFFQQALEAHTFIIGWDDHETANDCYWDYARDTLGAPDHPFQAGQPNGGDAGQLRQLKLDAQRAWAEYVPARVVLNSQATHPFDALRIYRQFRFGTLAELFVTDERTYRSPQPCGPDERNLTFGCDQQSSPDQMMLGTDQRNWFTSGVTQSSATWKIWANETFLGQFKIGPSDGEKFYINIDAWDGYEAERAEILSQFADAGVKNLIALTGDFHTYMAAYLKIDYGMRSNRPGRNLVGVEFMTPAVTSSTLVDYLINLLTPDERQAIMAEDKKGPSKFLFENIAKATNPHIQFFNSQEWGYSIVEFTPTQATYSAYSIPKSSNSDRLPRRLIRQIRVPVNRVQMQDIV